MKSPEKGTVVHLKSGKPATPQEIAYLAEADRMRREGARNPEAAPGQGETPREAKIRLADANADNVLKVTERMVDDFEMTQIQALFIMQKSLDELADMLLSLTPETLDQKLKETPNGAIFDRAAAAAFKRKKSEFDIGI